jgi:hypothetical protein
MHDCYLRGGSTCRTSQEEGRGGIRLHRRVRVSYEQEEDDDTEKRARVAARQGEERGEAACGSGRMGRPVARCVNPRN